MSSILGATLDPGLLSTLASLYVSLPASAACMVIIPEPPNIQADQTQSEKGQALRMPMNIAIPFSNPHNSDATPIWKSRFLSGTRS